MFVTPFPYREVCKRPVGKDGIHYEHVYSFHGKSQKRYIVQLQQYDNYVYAVKFYLQEKKNDCHKYEYLSNLNECSRVITTVGFIVRAFYREKDAYASFGFIGSNLMGEERNNTKRFRLYFNIISQLISPIDFELRYSIRNSICLLLNRNNTEPNLIDKISATFMSLYDFLPDRISVHR